MKMSLNAGGLDFANRFFELRRVRIHLALRDLAVHELKDLHELSVDGSAVGSECTVEAPARDHDLPATQNLLDVHPEAVPVAMHAVNQQLQHRVRADVGAVIGINEVLGGSPLNLRMHQG